MYIFFHLILCIKKYLIILVNITILELSMVKIVMMESALATSTSYITTLKEQSITSTARGTPSSTTFKGDSISTAIVQTSTSISTTIKPTSTFTTLVTEVLSKHNSTLRENNTFISVVSTLTFPESVTFNYDDHQQSWTSGK